MRDGNGQTVGQCFRFTSFGKRGAGFTGSKASIRNASGAKTVSDDPADGCAPARLSKTVAVLELSTPQTILRPRELFGTREVTVFQLSGKLGIFVLSPQRMRQHQRLSLYYSEICTTLHLPRLCDCPGSMWWFDCCSGMVLSSRRPRDHFVTTCPAWDRVGVSRPRLAAIFELRTAEESLLGRAALLSRFLSALF
jgi:hypothetical protein